MNWKEKSESSTENQNHKSLPFFSYVFVFLGFFWALNAKSEPLSYVIETKGKSNITLAPYIKNLPIKKGMVLPKDVNLQFEKAQASHITVVCGQNLKRHKIQSTNQLRELCDYTTKKPDAMRSIDDSDHPVILFPRQSVIFITSRIVWGSKSSNLFKLDIYDMSQQPKQKILSDVVKERTDKTKKYNQFVYDFSNEQRAKFQLGRSYHIVVTDINTGKTSMLDEYNKGFFELGQDNKLPTFGVGIWRSEHLKNYYESILLMKHGYYYESLDYLYSLQDTNTQPYWHFQKLNIYLEQGIPADYSAHEALKAIINSMEAKDSLTALLACENLYLLSPLLSSYWKRRITKLLSMDKFVDACPLFS